MLKYLALFVVITISYHKKILIDILILFVRVFDILVGIIYF